MACPSNRRTRIQLDRPSPPFSPLPVSTPIKTHVILTHHRMDEIRKHEVERPDCNQETRPYASQLSFRLSPSSELVRSRLT